MKDYVDSIAINLQTMGNLDPARSVVNEAAAAAFAALNVKDGDTVDIPYNVADIIKNLGIDIQSSINENGYTIDDVGVIFYVKDYITGQENSKIKERLAHLLAVYLLDDFQEEYNDKTFELNQKQIVFVQMFILTLLAPDLDPYSAITPAESILLSRQYEIPIHILKSLMKIKI